MRQKNSKLALYADGANLFKCVTSRSNFLDFCADIFSIERWVEEWQRKLNIGKCKISHNEYSYINFSYQTRNGDIVSKTTIKDLDTEISNDLSSSTHCAKKTRFAHIRRRQFQHSFTCKNRDFLTFLFYLYIRPLVEEKITTEYGVLTYCVENFQRKFTKTLRGL